MVNKQDSYWMEYTLDEKVDQKVCEYLREHHAEYRNTKQESHGDRFLDSRKILLCGCGAMITTLFSVSGTEFSTMLGLSVPIRHESLMNSCGSAW